MPEQPTTLSPQLTATIDRMCWDADQLGRFRRALRATVAEGRNVLPDATDDQAATIEAWALALLGPDAGEKGAVTDDDR